MHLSFSFYSASLLYFAARAKMKEINVRLIEQRTEEERQRENEIKMNRYIYEQTEIDREIER